MTPEQREELKHAAMKATPGPWHKGISGGIFVKGTAGIGGFGVLSALTPSGFMRNASANEEYAALANPAAILSLIAQVEALTRKTVELQRVYDERGLQIERLETALQHAKVEALTVPDDYFAPVVLNPMCACAKCNPNAAGRMMIVCATCGNKRCPHATDHRLACTDSNEPEQAGSSYGPTIPAIPGTKEGA